MIIFDGSSVSIDDIVSIAEMKAGVMVSREKRFLDRIARVRLCLNNMSLTGNPIYGTNTGFGDSCDKSVPQHLVNELPVKLYTYHGCGMGDCLTELQVRAVLAVLMTSLCRGFSGVSEAVIRQIEVLFHQGMMPVIPQEGSVGASGDLTPMSYVVAVLCGERQIYYRSQIKDTASVFKSRGINPVELCPKDSLAVMNGTSVMTALACLAFVRANYLSKLSAAITSMASLAVLGNANHFDEFLFIAKPHPGSQTAARRIRNYLKGAVSSDTRLRLQDRYSIRCAPHVIGTLEDTLPWLKQLIETELNSSCDNPIVNDQTGDLYFGGNFYGGHVALSMDTLKNVVANIAELLERQIALMVDIKFSHGLPANLSGCEGERLAINHGFKAVQISTSAWTAEALKNTMPASVFSRSTECHNQDKVSMGTIAARDCLRVIQLTEQVFSAALLVCCQGIDLRVRQNQLSMENLSSALVRIIETVRSVSPFLSEDRAFDHELQAVLKLIQLRRLPLL